MGQRRRFTPEFKRQAVELLNAGQRPAAEIAREPGVPAIVSTNGKRTSPRTAGRFRALGAKRNRPPKSRV